MPAYEDKHGRWRYRFAYGGKRYSGSAPKGANTKKAAAGLERDRLERLMSRRFTGVVPTIKEFIRRFLDHQKAHTKPLTYELHDTICTLHVEPHVGKLRLDQLRRAELEGLKMTWLAGGAAPRTVNTRLGVAVRILSLAAEWEILDSVPKVKLMKIAVDHPRFLSEDEAAALLEASKEHKRSDALDWYVMMLVGLRTGLRIGELRGLQWGDIDWDRALVNVRRTDPGRPNLDVNSPKGNRPRLVPLTPDAKSALLAWYRDAERRKAQHWVFPGVSSWQGKARYTTRGESNCSTAMGRIAKAAGLDEEVTFHTLRHTYASWLVMRGLPLSAIQELLGHASIRQTERYAHLAPGFAQHAAVATLDIPLVQPKQIGKEPAMLPSPPSKPSKK
jgi:integrase